MFVERPEVGYQYLRVTLALYPLGHLEARLALTDGQQKLLAHQFFGWIVR